MTTQELLRHFRYEYWATQAANPEIEMPTFYEFLLSRGFNRFELSARGIGKNVEA